MKRYSVKYLRKGWRVLKDGSPLPYGKNGKWVRFRNSTEAGNAVKNLNGYHRTR